MKSSELSNGENRIDNFCKTGNYVIYVVIIWVQEGNCKNGQREFQYWCVVQYEGRSINSRTAKFFVSKVKDKNCSMCCSCDIYCVLHIPWVIITTSLVTSLLFKILTDDVGMQQEQRIIIKFLVVEGVTNAEIHHRLAAVFKDDCLSLFTCI